jgi:hypothetical protein
MHYAESDALQVNCAGSKATYYLLPDEEERHLQPSNRAREQLGGNNCRPAIHPSAMTMQRSTQSVGQSVTRAANHPHPSMAEMNVQELHFYGSAPLRYVCQTVSEFLQDERTDGSSSGLLDPLVAWYYVQRGHTRGRARSFLLRGKCISQQQAADSRQVKVVVGCGDHASLSVCVCVCVKDG